MGYTGPVNASPPSSDAAIWEYGYVPSLAMGIVGTVTFLLVAAPHLFWFVTKLGTRSVHGLFFFAALIEALGFGARLSSHNYPSNGVSFLCGIVLVQIATILITAALYKSIQRVLKYTPEGRRLSPMRPRSLITLFVILDVVWVLMQIAGVYFVSGAQSASETNATPMFALGTSTLIFLAGNVLQAITQIIVTIFVFVIHRRARRFLVSPSAESPLLLPLLNQNLISFGLFFVRLIMRIAEGGQGAFGYSWSHEWCFAVFEYVPIILIFILWAARPLHKFLFPLGHRHGQGPTIVQADTGAAASNSDGSSAGEAAPDAAVKA